MFYSQFILAKKGPLGTIWIAAHLERKLRKNQVADTDIGVSVDSIICPEVPIALRLSSHLLLGVVRIYSRKVNYLFHDCSEALLKIKQAFRSTAVDLPPEESTAPYHSITLPETFDLDDFELPDAVLQGNFVDHHVSTREQITLQDKVENIAYTATQFGLDERFGDGDASQVGLDLDEELFVKKDLLLSNASVSSENMENQLSAPPETPFTPFVNMDIDDYQDDHDENRAVENSTDIPANYDGNFSQPNLSHERIIPGGSSNLQGYNIRTPDLNEIIFPHESTRGPDIIQNYMDPSCPANDGPLMDLLGPAQAPSTPGLLEEAVPVHLQDVPSSHQGKSSPFNDVGDIMLDRMQLESECHDLRNEIADPPSLSKCSDVPSRGAVELLTDNCEKSHESVMNEVLHAESADKIQNDLLVLDHKETVEACNFKRPLEEFLQDVESAPLTSSLTVLDDKLATGTLEINHIFPIDKPDLCEASQYKPAVVMDSSHNGHMVAPVFGCPLQPCSLKDQINGAYPEDHILGDNNHQLLIETFAGGKVSQDGGSSLEVQGEGPCSANFMDNGSLMNLMTGNVSLVNNYSTSSEYREPERVMVASMSTQSLPNDTELYIAGTRILEPDGSAHMYRSLSGKEHYPEPERIMLASTSTHGLNYTEQSTVGKRILETDGSAHIYHSLSSNQLSFGEGTPALLNGSSVKLPGLPRSKRKVSYIPDDDDLLASILVGKKRTSSSKAKHSPPLQLMPSSKRPRLTPKPGAPKRKVLIDDTMVLHADTIRQQLMNTDDIRRMRKKAPCTCLETWIIQKSLLEDEIFSESVLTGMSSELTSFHYQTYTQNVSVCPRMNANHSPPDASMMELPKESEITPSGLVGLDNFTVAGLEKDATEMPVHSNSHLAIETQHEPAHASLVHGAEGHIMDMRDTARLNFSTDDVTCSVISTEAHNSDCADDRVVKDSSSMDPDPCTINEPPLIEKDDDREASTVATRDEIILNPSPESFKEIVHTNEKDDTSVPAENARSAEDEPHVSESRSVTDEKIRDTETSTVIVSEEQYLYPQQGSFEESETPIQAGMGHMTPAEIAYNSDGGPHTSENRSVIIDGMQLTSVVNVNEVDMREQQMDTAVDTKALSPCEKSQFTTTSDIITSTVGETDTAQKSNQESGMHMENAEGAGATRDSCDLRSAVDENDHDTEFLNMDDEVDFDEDADYDIPDPAEAQSLENSGWSTRTRGVARYLKLLFDDETGYGRKNTQLDRLLSGKTRKEASRMFFETLVLKTKDYVHVEQDDSFASINIEPRLKLLKTTF